MYMKIKFLIFIDTTKIEIKMIIIIIINKNYTH